MRGRSFICVIAALLLMSISVSAQEGQKKSFGNADVIALIKAGMGDTVVIAKINQAPKVDFKLETEDLVSLKKGGATPAVISAMLERATPAAASTIQPQAGPSVSVEVGMTGTVVLVAKDGKKEITPSKGEFSVVGFSFVTFTYLNFPGLHAKLRTDDPRPSFLINSEFDPRAHYHIVKLAFDGERNARSLKVEDREDGFSASQGIRPVEKWTRRYTSQEEKDGVWRMTLETDLVPGEYGVFDGIRLFGFGVGAPITDHD